MNNGDAVIGGAWIGVLSGNGVFCAPLSGNCRACSAERTLTGGGWGAGGAATLGPSGRTVAEVCVGVGCGVEGVVGGVVVLGVSVVVGGAELTPSSRAVCASRIPVGGRLTDSWNARSAARVDPANCPSIGPR